MAPLLKYALSALCLLAVSPVSAAPVQAGVALERRQLAGVGAASDSIFTDTDNGVGYGVENAEDNTANTISGGSAGTSTGGGSSTGGGKAPPPPPPPPHRRQLDKISNGAGALANSVGAGSVGSVVQSNGDAIDGAGTSGSANAGAAIGSAEESTLESAGSAVP